MINWTMFDDAYEAGDFTRAWEVVDAGEDGTPILANKDWVKCFNCGQEKHEIPEMPADIMRLKCKDCGTQELQQVCRLHVGNGTPAFRHFSDGACSFCTHGVPNLNGVSEIDRLEKVLHVYKTIYEKGGSVVPRNRNMPYTADISRSDPTAIFFVIDQSASMDERMTSGETKAEFVADVLNKTLSNLIIRSTKADGVRHYFDLGVIAYGGSTVGPGFRGSLSGEIVHSVSGVEHNPFRIDTRLQKQSDGAGGMIEQTIKFPVWFDPQCAGGTPMCDALRQVAAELATWCDSHPKSYPPTVVHVTDGQSTDGDPEEIARSLQRMHTNDGESLLFNLHIDTYEGAELIFPDNDSSLPDSNSRMLFRCSSSFPPHLIEAATLAGYPVSAKSKFFGYRAGVEGVVDFFNIGTTPLNLR
jgi:hypothetical protein